MDKIKEIYIKKAIALGIVKGTKNIETVLRKLDKTFPERIVNRINNMKSH